MQFHRATIAFFHAEFANEGPTDDHGVTPSTLASAIDSFIQAPEVFCPDPHDREAVMLDLLALTRRYSDVGSEYVELRDFFRD
jgi:hypothetical protein